MRLDLTKQSSARTERVKGVDIHPTEPWILTTLYTGKVEIWSYATNTLVRTIQATALPVRAGRFIARKNWIVVGADDYQLRVYNYNTGEKVTQFEAHPDYIRAIAVHPTRPYLLTCSDDLTIRLWNWENSWKLEQTFQGHQHYILSVEFNPKDPNTFVTSCLDRTVKVWSLGSPSPNFTLLAHETRGVNYASYYPQSDKPYLLTTSDDHTIKVWDYQTKSCVAVLEGHSSNVSFAIYHSELPLIISGAEDGTLKFWNSNTYKLEKSINCGFERIWCVALLEKSNLIGVGCDLGYIIYKVGNEVPLFSIDSNNKLIYSRNSDIYQSVIKPSLTEGVKDGESLNLQLRELGTVEMYPQMLAHSPNGRYAAVNGDGEYIIYTALAWRSKTYGKALDFCWNTHDFSSACTYAVRESGISVKIFKNFEEHLQLDLVYQADRLYPGALLGVKLEGCISFYDWEHGKLVRRVDIDEDNQEVVWSDNGTLLAIVTNSGSSEGTQPGSKLNTETYFLHYDAQIYEEELNENKLDPEEGAENAFSVLYTLPVSEPILSGKFIGDVFVYTTASTNRLNYFVGGEVINLGHFVHPYYIVGYRAGQESKLYLIDKAFDVISWYVNSSVLELQTLVMRGDLNKFATKEIVDEETGEREPDLSTISIDSLSGNYGDLMSNFGKAELNQLSRFFEKLGYLSLAYAMSQDFDSKFLISLATDDMAQAYKLLSARIEKDSSSAAVDISKWRKLGDLALARWQVKLAQECYWHAQDYSTLLLLFSSTNNQKEIVSLAEKAESKGKYNLAWQAWWLSKNVDKCLNLLAKSERYPEAALFGINYNGSKEQVEEIEKKWKAKLESKNKANISERLVPSAEVRQQMKSVPPSADPNSLIDLDTKVEEEGPDGNAPLVNGNNEEKADEIKNEAEQS